MPVSLETRIRHLWNLDESSGDRLDSIGDGTMRETGVPIGSAAGLFGNAVNFTSTNSSDHLKALFGTVYDLAATDWTVAGWFNFSTVNATHSLWSQGISSVGFRKAGLYTGGGASRILRVWNTATEFNSSNQFALNTWTFAAVTRSGNDWAIYLDGTKTTNALGTVSTGQGDTRLGAFATVSSTRPPIGRMGWWGLWDYAWTDAEESFVRTTQAIYPFTGAPSSSPSPAVPVTYPATVVLREETTLPANGGSVASTLLGNLTIALAGTRLTWTHTHATGANAFQFFHVLIDGVFAGSQFTPELNKSVSGSDSTFYTIGITLPFSDLRNGEHTIQLGMSDSEAVHKIIVNIPFTVSGNTTRWSGSTDLYAVPGEVVAIPAASLTADDALSVRASPATPATVTLISAVPSNPSPGSTASAGTFTGVTPGDVTEWTLPSSLGDQMVVVRASSAADLPHLGRSGVIRTTYDPTDSFIPFSVMQGDFASVNGHGSTVAAAFRAAGLMPEVGFPRPPDGCASAAEWFTNSLSARTALAAEAASWGATPWNFIGDNLLFGDQTIVKDFLTASWFAAGVAQHVAWYRANVAGGPTYMIGRDEVENTYGSDPTNPTGAGAPIGPDAFPAMIAAFRAAGVPICWLGIGSVAHSFPRGQSLWHTATYSDMPHTIVDYSRADLGGYKRLAESHDLAADAEHHRRADAPWVQLVPIVSHTALGQTISAIPTEIDRKIGCQPRDLCAMIWEQLSRGTTALRGYLWESGDRTPFTPPGSATLYQYGPRFDDIDTIARDLGAALLLTAQTVQDYTPYLLGGERVAPILGPRLRTFKRASTRGTLLAIMNLSEGLERISVDFDTSRYTTAERFDGLSRDNLTLDDLPGLVLTAGQVVVLTGPSEDSPIATVGPSTFVVSHTADITVSAVIPGPPVPLSGDFRAELKDATGKVHHDEDVAITDHHQRQVSMLFTQVPLSPGECHWIVIRTDGWLPVGVANGSFIIR